MTLRGLGQTSADIQAMIVAAAQQFGVPPNIALGVASHESGFNPNAINHNTNGTTDYGVMQLNTTTVQTMGVSDPMDPQQNINAGVQLLSNLLNQYGGNTYNALWAYASGSGNVGPGKTPNAIAANFISYVTNYTPTTPIPAAPGSATASATPPLLCADGSQPASDGSCDDGSAPTGSISLSDVTSGDSESGGISLPVAAGIAGVLVLLWVWFND